MFKKLMTLAMTLVTAGLFAEPSVSDVKVAGHGFPWDNSGVEVRFTVNGIASGDICYLIGRSKDVATGFERALPSLGMRIPTNGTYRIRWDAKKDFGRFSSKQMHLKLGLVRCVQLWENGPYWADRNIGASGAKDDAGYFFWWGDTTGYLAVPDHLRWLASDRTVSNFSFGQGNTPTCGQSVEALKQNGWISPEGNLLPEHDAAACHWGDGWRMPTTGDFDALKANTDFSDRQYGAFLTGRGDYSSNFIFIQWGGMGIGNNLSWGADGYYPASSIGDTGLNVSLHINRGVLAVVWQRMEHGNNIRAVRDRID